MLIESVPNFSGDPAPMLEAMNGVAGLAVLDYSFDRDHNRSVITCAGSPDAVLEASVRAAARAVETIDLRLHRGVHPRIGALDVLPFIPLAGARMSDCARLAVEAGNRLWRELSVPVYLYEAAARREECGNLSDVRRRANELPPDIGGPAHHATAGATAVGARPFLIAFNVNLNTADTGIARRIAETIRESNGGLKRVKALGLALGTRGLAQVSMNLTDFTITSVAAAFDAVEAEAKRLGADVLESELIGLAPRAAIDEAVARHTRIFGWSPSRILENRLAAAGVA